MPDSVSPNTVVVTAVASREQHSSCWSRCWRDTLEPPSAGPPSAETCLSDCLLRVHIAVIALLVANALPTMGALLVETGVQTNFRERVAREAHVSHN